MTQPLGAAFMECGGLRAFCVPSEAEGTPLCYGEARLASERSARGIFRHHTLKK
jgi:hypothetical protein